MKYRFVKKAVSAALMLSMLFSVNVTAKQNEGQIIKKIYFNNLPTNALNVDSVTVEGSLNCHVVEEKGNKAFLIPASVDNTVYIDYPETEEGQLYYVSFRLGARVMNTGGTIGLTTTNGEEVTILLIDPDGRFQSSDGRRCGGIALGGYSDIKIKVDSNDKLYSIYVNNRCTLENADLIRGMEKTSGIVITNTEAASKEACLMLDDINVSVGNEATKPQNSQWNNEVLDFVPVEEENSKASNTVYFRENFDVEGEMSVKNTEKSNKIEQITDKKTGNGYLRVEQIQSDAMVDVNLNTSSKHLMFEMDIMHNGKPPKRTTLFYLRDTQASPQINYTIGTLQEGGILGYPGGSAELTRKVWHTVSVYLNLSKQTASIWLDGTLLKENYEFGEKMKSPGTWRIYLQAGGTSGEFFIDNLKVYDGKQPRVLGEDEIGSAVSIFKDDGAKNILTGKRALAPYASNLWYNNNKFDTDKPCIIKSDEALVTVDTFEKLFGEKVSVNGDLITIGAASMSVRSNTLKTGGKTYTLSYSPEIIEETLYLPVSGYGKAVLGTEKFYDDEHGLYIVSGSKINSADSRLKEANLYMFFERKGKEELKELLLGNMGGDIKKHPRISANADDFTRLREEIQTNQHKKKWFESVKQTADKLLETEASKYEITNGRLLDVANETFIRAQSLGFAYQITGDLRYAERLLKELKAVCAFPDWHPEHFLDTGTMAQAVGLGFDWIYDTISDDDKIFIMENAKKLGLDQAHDGYFGHPGYSDTFWLQTETNWGIIVNGGILTLATSISELDIDYAMEVVQNALRSMEYTIYRFAPDGAWYEGPNYWNYMFKNYAYSASGYETAFGEVHESVNYKGTDGLAKYRMFVSDPRDVVNNFNDSEGGRINSEGEMYLAHVKNDLPLMKDRAQYFDKYNGNGTVYDILWYDVNAENAMLSDYPLDSYYRETEFFSFRQSWDDPDALWVSATGGSADAAHDHVDTGTFVFNINGVRWAIDPGKENYSYDSNNPAVKAGYSSAYYYRRKGEGHNIVVINPDDKLEIDTSVFSKLSVPVVGKGKAYTSIDLSEAYKKNVSKYIRGYMIADSRRSFTVRDEITLRKNNSELYWFMHTEGEIIILDKNTAIIMQDGEQLKVSFLTNAQEYELVAMPAEKLPQSPKFTETSNDGITKLALKMKASGQVNITAKMSIYEEASAHEPISDTPIASWNIENDDFIAHKVQKSPARLDSIEANGELLFGFDPEIYSYKYYEGKNESKTVITAQASGKTEIVEYPTSDNNRLIEIRAYDSDGRYRPYVVRIVPYNPQYIGEYERHTVVGAEVSSEQSESGNVRSNSYDSLLNTRWSAYGRNEWMIHSLGAERKIDAIGLAFWKGNERIFSFEIYVSSDGINYTKVLEKETSGTTEEIEVYPLETGVTARFVKFVGHGSNAAVNGEWNNVLEMAALEKR